MCALQLFYEWELFCPVSYNGLQMRWLSASITLGSNKPVHGNYYFPYNQFAYVSFFYRCVISMMMLLMLEININESDSLIIISLFVGITKWCWLAKYSTYTCPHTIIIMNEYSKSCNNHHSHKAKEKKTIGNRWLMLHCTWAFYLGSFSC